MFHYRTLIMFLVVCGALLPAGCKQAPPPFECTDAIGCVTLAPDEPLKLGVLQDMSGVSAIHGIEQVRTIELAMARRDNRLFGHPIELQIKDEKCTAEGGRVAALKVVADPQIVAILGTTCSGAAKTASKIMSESGLVMIAGTNSAPSLTSIGGKQGTDWHPGYFRTIHNDSEKGRAAATFAFQDLHITKAATINDGDIYSQGYTDAFGQGFTELGNEIVLETTVNKGDTDMHPVLTAVANSGAELLFLALFEPEGLAIVRQVKEVPGLENILLIGAGTLLTDVFIESIGEDGIGMYFVGPALPSESVADDTLASEYEARYAEPPTSAYNSYAYDAANMLVKAIEAVVVQEKDGTLHIGRQALRDALYSTTGFEGVTGKLTCDKFGDCSAAKFNIVRLDNPSAGLKGMESNVVYTYMPKFHK